MHANMQASGDRTQLQAMGRQFNALGKAVNFWNNRNITYILHGRDKGKYDVRWE